ncbi:GNAT family N-acetyltransferase [Roseateles cellulosilyticus]|uniref:GNAT family N-acetyltransferase n=1 Tax=Pelomonas cellulosilytica TaxID=2906762 RepID=A0ABS8XY63_9BURK|nr:GNAT family N-acetyltransferase [Pelomonas sp. P8]MCE4556233.1 GNAT family N-acetyltransferase [Pelomonas sp. P8]
MSSQPPAPPATQSADAPADWDDALSAFGPPRPVAEPASPPGALAAPLATARAALERLSTWVAIRSLGRRHRHRIVDHLLALDDRDRYLRFGYLASDEQIRRYALNIDFNRDEVLGIFNRRLQLVALAHLAYGEPLPADPSRTMAEFGVSVLPQSRGRGLGRRLFDTAALHARNRGIDTLFIHALTENRPMLHIATAAGAVVERGGSESAAWLRLPPESFGSQVEQALERHLGEIDFQFKRQAQVISEFVDSVAEVKSHFDATGRAAKE